MFFQGGPGSEAPRPTGARDETTWVHRALREYRVLMLDQRGTGRSSPIGVLEGLEPQQQAEYLTHFRADSIVRDAELVREALGVERWSVLGQSFGGFCVLTYLSFFPQSLREAFFTGGLPPVGRPTDDVYSRTYPRVVDRCRQFYERYPDDRARVRDVHERIDRGEFVLPTGERLTARRFRQLGSMLGMSDGAPRLHYIVERPPGSPAFLNDVHEAIRFGRNPLYAVIHEACYADGVVTGWSADRLLPAEYAEDVTLFTGEHVYPWMFEDEPALRPLAGAAEILRAPRVAAPLRRAATRAQRGSRGRRDLRERHLRRPRAVGGDGRTRAQAPPVADERVRAQRPARGRCAHPRPSDLARARLALGGLVGSNTPVHDAPHAVCVRRRRVLVCREQ